MAWENPWRENKFQLILSGMPPLLPFLPSDEDPPIPQTFWGIVFNNWMGRMTGGFIGVTTLIMSVWGITLLPLVFFIVSIVTLFVVCSHVWCEERKAKLIIINQNNELKSSLSAEIVQLRDDVKLLKIDSRPKFVGSFQQVGNFVIHATGEERKQENAVAKFFTAGTRFIVRVGFVNENSTPSTIHNFRLTIKTDVGETFSAVQVEDINKFNNSKMSILSGTNFVLLGLNPQNTNDLLNLVLDSKNCEKGQQINGTLLFDFPVVFEGQKIINYQLEIEDAWGDLHKIVDWGKPPRPSKNFFQPISS